jgi:alpha-galactosidase
MQPLADLLADGARVYEEGWQSWSPAGIYPATATSPRPRDCRDHVMGWRPGKELPSTGFQGEGLLAVETRDGAFAWFAADAPSIRAEVVGSMLRVSADGPVRELRGESLDAVLPAVGEALRVETRAIGPGWSTWSCYFHDVTPADVLDNLAAIQRLELPIETVQVDDGWQAWGDRLRGVIDAIRETGSIAGLWTAPFLTTAPGAYAGWNWEHELRALDLSTTDALERLEQVYRTFREWGVRFHKLDFLYAGAIAGVDEYREGLRAIRRGAGDDAVLLGCGAPLLPSVGLVDAMRVGGDVLPVPPEPPRLEGPLRITSARRWMNGRLWVSDPDHLVVRPEIAEREAWADHVTRYGGLVFSGDRLGELDERGLALTRRALAYSGHSR